jgi:hypothetical protein
MTETPHDGGPAFPQSDLSGYGIGPAERSNGGMTLRDWFAGQALAIVYQRLTVECDPTDADIALQAYFLADAMLAERNGEN